MTHEQLRTEITNQYKDKYNIDKDFRNNIDLLKAQEKRIKSLKNKGIN